jgi:hypothetical protein
MYNSSVSERTVLKLLMVSSVEACLPGFVFRCFILQEGFHFSLMLKLLLPFLSHSLLQVTPGAKHILFAFRPYRLLLFPFFPKLMNMTSRLFSMF